MALYPAMKFLSFAVLFIGISIEVSDTKEVCEFQLLNKQILEEDTEAHDISSNNNLKHGTVYWQWVCKDSDEIPTATGEVNYEEEDEDPKKRVRRGWGSRRRSSSSGGGSGGWGSRRRSSSSGSSSSSWGSRRRSSSSSGSSSRSWGSRRRSSSSSGSSSRIWGSRRRSPSSSSSSSSLSSKRSSGLWGKKKSGQNPKPKTNAKKSGAWDKVHTALDVAGMVPGVGNVADGINAGLHAARGNWKDAALSAAAMIPGAGQAATAGKLAKKSSKNLKEFLERAVVTNTKKRGKTISQTDESYDVAKKIFQKETGVKPKDTGLTHAKTKDGKYHLTVRDHSKTGPKTMDVKDMETGHVTKTRCLGGPCEGPKKK